MPIAIVTFAIYAALLMLLSVPGVAVLPLPGRRRSVESASPHSPNVIPGAVYVNFAETGLTSGTSWSVTMTPSGGFPSTKSSTTWEIQFDAAENTKYTYSVSTVFGTTPSPSSGTLNIGTQGETVDVTYSPAYEVTFAQNSSSALPTGTQWTAKLGSSSYSATGTSISVGVSDGTFSYTINGHTDYTQTPASGSVNISGASQTIVVTFTADAVFQESGLPSGTTWSVAINHGTPQSTTSQSMYFPDDSSIYYFTVTTVDGWGTNTSWGKFSLANNQPVTINLSFVRPFILRTMNLMDNVTAINSTSQFNNTLLSQNNSYNLNLSWQKIKAVYDHTIQGTNDNLNLTYETVYGVKGLVLNYTQPVYNGSTDTVFGNVLITETLSFNNTTNEYKGRLSADFTPTNSSQSLPYGDALIQNFSSNESTQLSGVKNGLAILIERYENSGNSTLVRLSNYYSFIEDAFSNFTTLLPENVSSLNVSNTSAQIYDYNLLTCYEWSWLPALAIFGIGLGYLASFEFPPILYFMPFASVGTYELYHAAESHC